MQGAQKSFGNTAIVLHWVIAAAILTTVPIGLYAAGLDGEAKTSVLAIHKSIGLAIFALSCIRLGWRLGHPAPEYPAVMPAWQRLSAAAAHWTLYALILTMPLTGYVAEAARGRDTTFFSLFPVPSIVPLNRKLSFYAETAHTSTQYVLYVLVAIHVGAALYHQAVLRDRILSRMWPARETP